MVSCADVIHFLDTYLDIASIPDSSHNGLQVEGKAEISKIAFGVSASMEFFKQARYAGADLLVVHHGLLWGQEQPVTGMFRSRVAFLLENNLNLAAYHLPLDKHSVVGNNAQLARVLQVQAPQPFGQYHGNLIGYWGQLNALPLEEIRQKLESFCQTTARVFAYGPREIKTVGIVSGGAYSMLPQAISQKLDLYITGALDEPVQEWCREGKINCMALGHYNSEKCGVKALMEMVNKRFPSIATEFIDIANPL